MTPGNAIERRALDTLADAWTAAWMGQAEFADCCTGGVGYEDPLSRVPLTGPGALAVHAETMRGVFPDVRVSQTAAALERDGRACFPWLLEGTHLGEYGPLPPTEKRLALHGLHYVELDDDKVLRARGFFDLYEGATQLGLLPARGGLGEAALLLLRGFGLRR